MTSLEKLRNDMMTLGINDRQLGHGQHSQSLRCLLKENKREGRNELGFICNGPDFWSVESWCHRNGKSIHIFKAARSKDCKLVLIPELFSFIISIVNSTICF